MQDVFSSFFYDVNIKNFELKEITSKLDSHFERFSISQDANENVESISVDDSTVAFILNSFEENHAASEEDITLVIPSRNGKNVVNAINSLGENNFRIVVALNNTSFEFEKKFIETNCKLKNKPFIFNHTFPDGVKFSFAEICNSTVKKYVKTKYVVFFNDDLVCDSSVVTRLSAYVKYDIFGAVAPALKWPSNVIQNAGIFGGIYRNRLPGLYGRGMNYNNISKNPLTCDAVTGACLMIRTELFNSLNGFDEERFAVAYNDVDLGYRLNEKGYVTVSMNHIAATHVEGASRGTGIGNDNPLEEVAISDRYGEFAQKSCPDRLQLLLDPESNDFLLSKKHSSFHYHNKNVLVFTHNMKLEGASRIAYDTAAILSRNGYNVSVLALEGGEYYDSYQEISDNIYICGWEFFQNPHVRAKVKYWLQSNDISLAICNTIICSAALYPVTNNIECKQINYIHESESFDHHLNHFGHFWAEQSALSVSNCFNIFVSRYTVNVYRHLLNNENWTVLYNYHNLVSSLEDKVADKVPDMDTQGYRFVTVGSVCERKNQKMVFDAMDYFEENKVKASFTVVGARNDQYHHEMLAKLSDSDYQYARLDIVNETPNVDDYYSKADVFISFSNMESFPITLLEAASHGLVLMSTSVFGAKEMVVDGVNGFLFDIGDRNSLHYELNKLCNSDLKEIKSNSKVMLGLWPGKKEFDINLSQLIETTEHRS